MRALVRALVRTKVQVRGHISEWTSGPWSTGGKTAGQSTKRADRSAVPLRVVADRTATPPGGYDVRARTALIRELIEQAKEAKKRKGDQK